MLNFTTSISEKLEPKSWLLLIFCSLITYVGIIVFGFITVTSRIESSGFSTTDMQNVSSRMEMDAIVNGLRSVADDVYLLYLLDYLFIIAGFALFISLNSLFMRYLSGKMMKIPQIGIVLTFISRSLDAFEDLFALLIFSNPQDYWTGLILLLNLTESLKWFFVTIEYSLTGIALLLVIASQFKSEKNENRLQN